MARAPVPHDAAWFAAVGKLKGLRLGRCARRILLLAPLPTEEPRIIGAERAGRAAAESHRRAMRRLAETGLLELSWQTETVEIAATARTDRVRWDPDDGVFRQIDPDCVPVEREVSHRAARLTPLGTIVVDRLRPALETGKRIRWAAVDEHTSE